MVHVSILQFCVIHSTRTFEVARTPLLSCNGSLHRDCHPHPRMDAALKEMLPFRQVRDIGVAVLQNASFGRVDVGKAAPAFRSGFFSSIESLDKGAANFFTSVNVCGKL